MMDSKISLNLVKNWQALCHDIVFVDVAALLIQNHVISVNEYQLIITQPENNQIESLLLILLKKKEQVLLTFVESLKKDYSWLAEKLREGYSQDDGKDETDASPVVRTDFGKESENDMLTEDEKHIKDECAECNNLNSVNNSHRLNHSINNKSRTALGRRKIMKHKVKNKLKSKIQTSEAFISSTTEVIKPVQNDEITDEAIAIVRRSSLVSRSWTTIAHALSLTERVNEIRYKVVLHGEDLSMCVVYLIKDWQEMFPKIATLSKLIEVLRCEGFNEVGDKLSDILFRDNKKLEAVY